MTVLPDAARFFEDVGAKLAGDLVCLFCGRRQPLTKDSAIGYLRAGWPKCCGETMQVEPREPDEDVKR